MLAPVNIGLIQFSRLGITMRKYFLTSSNMVVSTDQLCTKTNKLLRNSLLATAVVLLSSCSTVDKAKDPFGGEDERSVLIDSSSNTASAPATLNPRQQLLVSIQESLAELGYAPGRTDGIMDSQSEAAIQDFQLDNDMRINGRPSTELLQTLERAIRLR